VDTNQRILLFASTDLDDIRFEPVAQAGAARDKR
jgi:hypothetical protein